MWGVGKWLFATNPWMNIKSPVRELNLNFFSEFPCLSLTWQKLGGQTCCLMEMNSMPCFFHQKQARFDRFLLMLSWYRAPSGIPLQSLFTLWSWTVILPVYRKLVVRLLALASALALSGKMLLCNVWSCCVMPSYCTISVAKVWFSCGSVCSDSAKPSRLFGMFPCNTDSVP